MNMKQLRYVLVLAREGSFSRAADALNISQPSLSQYIKKIEKDLGVTLFDRTGGDVRITDAGQVYIDAGRDILDLEKQMERKFEDLSSFRSGSIVVGVSPYRCVHLMPEIVRRFGERYPGMRIIIEERAGIHLLNDAEHGDFDLCIATLPVDEKIFVHYPVMREEVLLAVNTGTDLYTRLLHSAGKAKKGRYPVADIKSLANEPVVTLSSHQPTQKLLEDLCSEAGIRIVNAAECRTVETQFSMVCAGIGAALIPSGISAFSDREKIAYFSLKQPVACREMVVIHRKDRYISRPVADLIDIITHLDI